MKTKTFNMLIEQINYDCEHLNYYFVYGILKETKVLWEKEENKSKLHPYALMMLETI